MSPLAEALGVDPGRVAVIIDTLRERDETVATAESLTGGLVCAVLTAVPGASDVVRGGVVVYASELKVTLAAVNRRALDEHGAVHPVIAEQLASGARRRCLATWGLGLTGVAGPDPQDGVGPGTVHIGLAGPDGREVRTVQASGGRHAVRAAAVGGALDLLFRRLQRLSRQS
jgi:nicotinamide-nucleotide amidase